MTARFTPVEVMVVGGGSLEGEEFEYLCMSCMKEKCTVCWRLFLCIGIFTQSWISAWLFVLLAFSVRCESIYFQESKMSLRYTVRLTCLKRKITLRYYGHPVMTVRLFISETASNGQHHWSSLMPSNHSDGSSAASGISSLFPSPVGIWIQCQYLLRWLDAKWSPAIENRSFSFLR